MDSLKEGSEVNMNMNFTDETASVKSLYNISSSKENDMLVPNSKQANYSRILIALSQARLSADLPRVRDLREYLFAHSSPNPNTP